MLPFVGKKTPESVSALRVDSEPFCRLIRLGWGIYFHRRQNRVPQAGRVLSSITIVVWISAGFPYLVI